MNEMTMMTMMNDEKFLSKISESKDGFLEYK